MPMMRFALAVCCALVALSAWAQFVPRPRVPGGGGNTCPSQPADCQINVQVFDFGRGQMSPSSPAINGHNTVSVTCTRSPRADGFDVQVFFQLKAVPADPARYMRDSHLEYLRYFMYVDSARLRYWGDGTQGTSVFEGTLFLDNRNRVGTLAYPVYGRVDAGQLVLPGQWLGATVTRLEYKIGACN
jgi:spore coat protein U-like protein